jgi:hypothetical protein
MVLMSNRLPPWTSVLGSVLLHFDREIRKPFLSVVLSELHERVEDATMAAALCAIDRVVLPVDVLDYPARVIELRQGNVRNKKLLTVTAPFEQQRCLVPQLWLTTLTTSTLTAKRATKQRWFAWTPELGAAASCRDGSEGITRGRSII